MNEAIKKANMHYVGFVDTCMQMGLEKEAADRIYKEALIKNLLGFGRGLNKARAAVTPAAKQVASAGVVPKFRLGSRLKLPGGRTAVVRPIRPVAAPAVPAAPVAPAAPTSGANTVTRVSGPYRVPGAPGTTSAPMGEIRNAGINRIAAKPATPAAKPATPATPAAPAATTPATPAAKPATPATAPVTPATAPATPATAPATSRARAAARRVKKTAPAATPAAKAKAQAAAKAKAQAAAKAKAQAAAKKKVVRKKGPVRNQAVNNAAVEAAGEETMPMAGNYMSWLQQNPGLAMTAAGVGTGLLGYGLGRAAS